MNSVELMDKKNQLKLQAEAILSGAEKETRKLSDEENTKFEALKKEIDEVDNEIRELNEKLNKTTKRSMEKFSLLTLIHNKQHQTQPIQMWLNQQREMKNKNGLANRLDCQNIENMI